MARWSVSVFAKNEEDSVSSCLAAVDAALAGSPSVVTVIVNGSTDRTFERVCRYRDGRRPDMRAFRSSLASKANAWNSFVHDLKPEADLYFFVDAYARVEPDAFRRLAAALERHPQAHAATSVPTTGRSASLVAGNSIEHGGLHGTLHVLRREFVDGIVHRGIRQPFGLYRGDGLIGAMAMHDFDARRNRWDKQRVAVVTEPTWHHRPLSPFRRKDLERHFNRLVMQARGRLENAAIRDIIYKDGFEALPQHADAMIGDWLSRQSAATLLRLWLEPFTALAMRKLRPGHVPDRTGLEMPGRPA
ncbi:MAG: glycosyltransferase family 2 protein [Geminicoccaceae bacterium]|nr:glycosyltransferase family 2 protein [Geminicoccaceae bacterium]